MTAESVRAFLRRLGYPESEPIRAQDEGIVNAVWFCGDLVVRVNKDPEYADDCFCEAIAHPRARAVSEMTPEWLHFEAEAPEYGVPASIQRRINGANLTKAQVPNLEAFYIKLALAAKVFHDQVPNDIEGLDEPWTVSIWPILRHETGLEERLKTLDREGAFATPSEKRFVHQDLHANNVLVHEGRLAAIIDWGDAAIGDPACDLRFVPARFLEPVLSAYGADEGMKWRVRLHVLDQFLYCRANGRAYGPNADSTFEDVVALFD